MKMSIRLVEPATMRRPTDTSVGVPPGSMPSSPGVGSSSLYHRRSQGQRPYVIFARSDRTVREARLYAGARSFGA